MQPHPQMPFDLLMALDSTVSPGLTPAEFKKLFVRCIACNIIMTRRVLENHVCLASSTMVNSENIIDLTLE